MTAGEALRDEGTEAVIAADKAVWKDLPGWNGIYQVSSRGDVCRVDGKTVSCWLTPNGYRQVNLHQSGRRPSKRAIHVLVLTAFAGPRPTPKTVARHLDGNKSNNSISNLRWGTQSQNLYDSIDHGNHQQVLKTRCPSGHPYDAANTRIRPNGHRVCRTCDQARCREYYQRRTARNLVGDGDR